MSRMIKRAWMVSIVTLALYGCGLFVLGACSSFNASNIEGDGGQPAHMVIANEDADPSAATLRDVAGAITDAGADAPSDVSASVRCIDGGACSIDCADGRCAKAEAVCPPNHACTVLCRGAGSCKKVECAPGHACSVICVGEDACLGLQIVGSSAVRMCLRCFADGGGPACGELACALPASCNLQCGSSGCGAGMNDCGNATLCVPQGCQ